MLCLNEDGHLSMVVVWLGFNMMVAAATKIQA